MTYVSPLDEIRSLVAQTHDPHLKSTGGLARLEAEARKWRLIYDYLARRPFRVRSLEPRSQQWRDALAHVRDLAEPELIDWFCQQSEVWRNRERGLPDMRPRKKGTCHGCAVVYAQDRARKAAVVLRWAQIAREAGADMSAKPSKVFTSAHRPAPKTGNPLARSGSLWHERPGEKR